MGDGRRVIGDRASILPRQFLLVLAVRGPTGLFGVA